MKLSNPVTLSLSNQDLNDLVADALDRSVLYCPGQDVVVEDVTYNVDKLRWDIDFTLDEEREE